MKKKGYQAPRDYKRYVQALCDRLKREFYLLEYDMSISFHKDLESNRPHGTVPNAYIHIDIVYLKFEVHMNDEKEGAAFRDKDYYHIARVLTHEFSHLLTEPIYDIACDAISNQTKKHLEEVRERQTERIAGVIDSLMPDNWYLPKKILKGKNQKP